MNQSISRCKNICMIVALFLSLPLFAQSEKQSVEINIPEGEEVSQWIYDKESGRIFAGVYNKNEIREYSGKDGSLVRSFSVEKPFRSGVLGSRLVVASKGLPSVTVFDLNKNTENGKISLSFPVVSLFKGPGQESWLGAIREEKRDKREICCIDLDARKVTKTFDVAKAGLSVSKFGYIHFMDSKLLVIASGDTSGIRYIFEFDEAAFTFKRLTHCKGYGAFYPGPNGRFSFAKNTMFDRLMKREIRKFPGEPCTGHRTKDLVVSYKRGNLYFNSYSGELLGKISIKKSSRYRSSSSGTIPHAAPCFIIDEGRNSIIYGDDDICSIPSLNQSGIELKDLVLIKAPPQITHVHGSQVKIPLTFTDPDIPVKSMVLKAAPKGVLLKNNTVVWSPGPKDVGHADIVVEASHNGVKDTVTIGIDVINQMVESEF